MHYFDKWGLKASTMILKNRYLYLINAEFSYNHGNLYSHQQSADQQYVQLDTSEPFVTNTSTAIADLEASLFAKYAPYKQSVARNPLQIF